MPGYEPFLLCDFHVHTKWSDGRLAVREVVDLYGSTGKFDVLAITDHILMKKDVLARAGRIATLGQRRFGVREVDLTRASRRHQDGGSAARQRHARHSRCGVTQNRPRPEELPSSRSISRGTSARISPPTPSCAKSGGRAR